jgi:hypothetical protein
VCLCFYLSYLLLYLVACFLSAHFAVFSLLSFSYLSALLCSPPFFNPLFFALPFPRFPFYPLLFSFFFCFSSVFSSFLSFVISPPVCSFLPPFLLCLLKRNSRSFYCAASLSADDREEERGRRGGDINDIQSFSILRMLLFPKLNNFPAIHTFSNVILLTPSKNKTPKPSLPNLMTARCPINISSNSISTTSFQNHRFRNHVCGSWGFSGVVALTSYEGVLPHSKFHPKPKTK